MAGAEGSPPSPPPQPSSAMGTTGRAVSGAGRGTMSRAARRLERVPHACSDPASRARRSISSSDTSSVCVATHQVWPNGSVRPPLRSP